MNLTQFTDGVHDNAKNMRKHTGEIDPLVNVFRDGEPIYTFLCHGKKEAYEVAYLSAVGMIVDAISMTFEGWMTTTTENPDTGKKWGPGEMQAFVEAHPGTDVVGTSLVTYTVDRDFTIDSRVSNLVGGEWVEEDMSEATKMDGEIPATLRKVMGEQTLDTTMGAQGVDITEVEKDLGGHTVRMYYQDRGILKEIGNRGLAAGVMVFSAPNSERDKLIQGDLPEDFDKKGYASSNEFLKRHQD